jgi:hypothetical protein
MKPFIFKKVYDIAYNFIKMAEYFDNINGFIYIKSINSAIILIKFYHSYKNNDRIISQNIDKKYWCLIISL